MRRRSVQSAAVGEVGLAGGQLGVARRRSRRRTPRGSTSTDAGRVALDVPARAELAAGGPALDARDQVASERVELADAAAQAASRPGGGGTSTSAGSPPAGRASSQQLIARPSRSTSSRPRSGPRRVVVEHRHLVGGERDHLAHRVRRSLSRRASSRLDRVDARAAPRPRRPRPTGRRPRRAARRLGWKSPGGASRARAQQLQDRDPDAARDRSPARAHTSSAISEPDRRARTRPPTSCRACAGRRACACEPARALVGRVVRVDVEVDDGRRSAATSRTTRAARSRARRAGRARPRPRGRRAARRAAARPRTPRARRAAHVVERIGSTPPLAATGLRTVTPATV